MSSIKKKPKYQIESDTKPIKFISGTIIFVLLLFLGLFAPWICQYSYQSLINVGGIHPNLLSSLEHPFGTVSFGWDVFGRILYGLRSNILTCALIMGISLLISFGMVILYMIFQESKSSAKYLGKKASNLKFPIFSVYLSAIVVIGILSNFIVKKSVDLEYLFLTTPIRISIFVLLFVIIGIPYFFFTFLNIYQERNMSFPLSVPDINQDIESKPRKFQKSIWITLYHRVKKSRFILVSQISLFMLVVSFIFEFWEFYGLTAHIFPTLGRTFRYGLPDTSYDPLLYSISLGMTMLLLWFSFLLMATVNKSQKKRISIMEMKKKIA
ncbi:hypothetical protein [Candidatus Lokiarchaeum ossiferum]|uniref:hypothetical protein n=1 Tax=Candidatus Lokiarchaeum ossiferum TaxID=2951803 RepID=UPI00352C1C23